MSYISVKTISIRYYNLLHVFMSGADEMLKSLETERNLYEMRQYLPLEHDVFGEEDRKDITEHWTEDKLDEWRGTKKIFLHFNLYYTGH